MSDRPVTLDLRAPANTTGGLPSAPGRDSAASADRDAAERFRDALANQGSPGDQAGRNALPATASPFDLLAARTVDRDPSPSVAEPRQIVDAVCDLVDRILINDGSAGRREVRMTLSDDLLPGVTVRVYEDEGAWVADFETADPQSFIRLAEPVDEMAQQLANLLEHDAIWRVADRTDAAQIVRARSAPDNQRPEAGRRT